MEKVAIVGVGLIGGSFALALRRAGFTGRIVGVSSPATVEQALAAGVIDEAASLEDAAGAADLVYLAQPISRILTTIEKLNGCLNPKALVTDAGSTKVRILARAAAKLHRGVFLGGHPMAGKEVRGVEAADAALFQGRTWFLCPHQPDDLLRPEAACLLDWIKRIGAVPVPIRAEDHDQLVGFTSHLPQLASTALASVLAGSFEPAQAAVAAGPGLADMTRLARSSWEIWQDILATNPEAIDRALGLYIEKLIELRRGVASGGLARQFELASSFADLLRKPIR